MAKTCIAVTAIFMLIVPVVSFGCSYYSYPDPPTEYIVSRTKTIFVGTLLQKVSRIRKEEGDRFKVHSLTFRIEQNLKGDNGKTRVIEYREKITRRSSCEVEPPNPIVGEQWVIYDGYNEGDGAASNIRNPELLSWRLAAQPGGSREKLMAIKDAIAHPQSTFYGEVEMAIIDEPPDDEWSIRAELLNSSRRAVTVTVAVEKGRFSFPNLEPGTYFVRLRSSKQLSFVEPVTVQEDSSDLPYFVDFRIQMRPRTPEFLNFTLTTLVGT